MILVLIINIVNNSSVMENESFFISEISTNWIFINNTIIATLLILLPKVMKFSNYILYYYNSIMFSVYFSIAIESIGFYSTLHRLAIYAPIEILGLSISFCVGKDTNLSKLEKFVLFIISIILLRIAAYIEMEVINNVI